MSQVLRLSGLEDGGLLTEAALSEYNRLKTNPAKRAYLVRLVRNGFALDEMGLSPIIELLQVSDGKKFLKMSDRERLQRLLTMISALLGESADVPVAARPAAPAAPENVAASNEPVQPVPAAPVPRAEPAPEPEPQATSQVAQNTAPAGQFSDEDDKPQSWGNASAAKPLKGRQLRSATHNRNNNS